MNPKINKVKKLYKHLKCKENKKYKYDDYKIFKINSEITPSLNKLKSIEQIKKNTNQKIKTKLKNRINDIEKSSEINLDKLLSGTGIVIKEKITKKELLLDDIEVKKIKKKLLENKKILSKIGIDINITKSIQIILDKTKNLQLLSLYLKGVDILNLKSKAYIGNNTKGTIFYNVTLNEITKNLENTKNVEKTTIDIFKQIYDF